MQLCQLPSKVWLSFLQFCHSNPSASLLPQYIELVSYWVLRVPFVISSSLLDQQPAHIAVARAGLCLPQFLVAFIMGFNIKLFYFFSRHKHFFPNWISFIYLFFCRPKWNWYSWTPLDAIFGFTVQCPHQPTSAPQHRAKICCSICCKHRDYNGFRFGPQFPIPGDIPQENILVKPTFKSLPTAAPLQTGNLIKIRQRLLIQLHCIFLFYLPVWHLSVSTGTRQLGFVSKFKYSLSWQCGPLCHLHCQHSCQ